MTTFAKPRSVKGRAVLCARIAQTKLAHDILILDLSAIESAPSEFFVIVSCDSVAQLRAITEAIDEQCKSLGMGDPRVHGKSSESWVVLDYFDVVVHVMTSEARAFYTLERLWGDAEMYSLTPSGATKAVRSRKNS